jgi:8-oxo-dGTP pyrophosphatase MutT (NUDIX family)
VVKDDHGQVLIIQRADNDQWEIPGGIVGLDEELHAALLREIQEETGLQVRVGRLTGVYKNMSLGIVALVFECEPAGGQLQTSEESTDVRWIDPRQLPELVGDRIRVRIEDALVNDRVPTIRDHSHPARTT